MMLYKFRLKIIQAILSLTLALFAGDSLFAQGSRKVAFSSINQGGITIGSGGEAALLQTINGLKWNKSFTGIGVGMDYYGDRTIPLYLDYRKEFLPGKNTPFAFADAGLNFLWLNFIQREQKLFPDPSTGWYYDVGVGWKVKGKNSRGVLFAIGYSLKQVKYKVISYSSSSIPQAGAENYDRYLYTYRRLSLKLGLQL